MRVSFSLKKIDHLNLIFFAYILLLMCYYFLRWPIISVDTDTWRHLHYGWYLWTHGEIPQTSFYSFVTPVREFYNYSWLFQGLIYGLYKYFGLFGLIALRGIIFFVILIIVFQFLKKNQNENWLPVALTAVFIALAYQNMNIRPYMFTFLSIAIFLYVLEYKSKYIYILPFTALLWHKTHGVSFPIMLMLVLAYQFEFMIQYVRLRRKGNTPVEALQADVHKVESPIKYLFWLTITLVTIFITNDPFRFVTIPFASTQLSSGFISEFARPTLKELFCFKLMELGPKAAPGFCFILSGAIIFTNLCRRNLRISHFLIFLGSIVLVLRGWRFTSEYALLTLPCINTANWKTFDKTKIKQASLSKLKFAHFPFYFMLAVLPLLYLNHLWGNRPQYPFTAKKLPFGVVTFLKKVDTGGKILNYHMTGGYLQWTLSPNYKIFINRQILHLFNPKDFFVANNAVHEKRSLARFINNYAPTFVSLPREWDNAPLMDDFKDYALVFFDDYEVLYVDRHALPKVAEKYRFLFINPFYLDGLQLNALSTEDKSKLKTDLLFYTQTFTHSRIVNQTLSEIYQQEKNSTKAARFAQAILDDFPEVNMGYNLLGDAFQLKADYAEAINMYKISLTKEELTKNYNTSDVYYKLWNCYYQTEQYTKAYAALKKKYPIFAPQTSYKGLWQLAITALYSGKKEESLMLMRFALYKAPPEDLTFKHKVEALITRLGS